MVRELTHSHVIGGELALSEESVLRIFRREFDISGRRVLEIGGCMPADLTRDAAEWWSVDPLATDIGRDGHVIRMACAVEDIEDNIPTFDFVFACNSFQHIRRLTDAYRRVASATRAGAIVFAHFGPIWSAPDGSHIENLEVEGFRYDFWRSALLPSWAQLVLEPNEIRALAIELHGEKLGTAIGDYVANSDWINRVTLREHLELPRIAGLDILRSAGGSTFGYSYNPPQVPSKFTHRFTSEAVACVARTKYHLSWDEIQIRDLQLVLVKP